VTESAYVFLAAEHAGRQFHQMQCHIPHGGVLKLCVASASDSPMLDRVQGRNVTKKEVAMRQLPVRASLILSLLAFGTAKTIPAAHAQTYPSNVIRIVAPFGAGTPPDIISRLVATELSESQGWQVIVENRPGGVTTIAGSEVLKQPADGYAIYAMALPVSASPALVAKMPYQLEAEFLPVIKVSTSYNVLVVNPSLPAKSVGELVAYLKSQPDKFNFSSGGFGTPAHLVGEMFKLQTGVRAAHVPYQQFPQAIADLLNGTNHYMFITTLPVVDLIAAGKLRALAVTSPKRIEALKDVPTVVEQQFPDLQVADWVGFAVKIGTPNEIVVRLNGAINKALTSPKVRDGFAKLGAEPAGGTPAEFGDLLKSQIAHWRKVVAESGIKMPQ
jgi:tripartite-type tricarboxylate transporter receptor subunit TctC